MSKILDRAVLNEMILFNLAKEGNSRFGVARSMDKVLW